MEKKVVDKISVFFFVLLILLSSESYSQKENFKTLPGTSVSILLPDQSFQINNDSSGFFSEKFGAKLETSLLEESGTYSAEVLIEMMRTEFKSPGFTVLLDTSLVEKELHLFKIRVEFDITDSSPAKSGQVGIVWICLFGKNNCLGISGEYRFAHDYELSDKFLNSFLSLQKNGK